MLLGILKDFLIEYQELSITFSLAILLIALDFLQDSGDDDDQGGGKMMPIPLKN